ncbi:MAG: NAD(P)-binding domain-containing protein [Candidatus Sericytochromatia bacterium]|nr:NAD(P)-binding domain-containing protein [Candidatus Sericytochromatia bacterium]
MFPVKIGILGSGLVGQALAKGLADLGHDVVVGSRGGDKLRDFRAGTNIGEGTFEHAARHGEVVVLALKGEVAEAVVEQLAEALTGKVILDTTNPIAGAVEGGVVPYFTLPGESLLQRLQQRAPQGRFVKCFNSVAAHLMVKPDFGGRIPAMFICGDDQEAKALASGFVEALGWATEDVGTSAAGHAVEALCQLWCAPGFLREDWHHAFAVLRN